MYKSFFGGVSHLIRGGLFAAVGAFTLEVCSDTSLKVNS